MDLSINPPRIVNSRVVGNASAHGDLRAWDEVFPDGSIKSFEEYHSTVYLKGLDINMGLVLVRQIA
jgi:hypothetical protein